MESLQNVLELATLLGAFSALIYHVATVKSKIYRTIDATCDIANNKINHLEKQLELHISEYKQQILFNQELSQHWQEDIDNKFERLYVILNDYKDICKQLNCFKRMNDDEIGT